MPKTSLMLVHDSSAPAFDPSALRDVDGEPRVRDIELGFSLGVKNPAATIRKLIARNMAELNGHGVLSTTETTTTEAGGRPGKEYWLNEGQALVVCALSRTPQAALVRKALIDVFMAYRRGHLTAAAPPAPKPPTLADAAATAGLLAEQLAAVTRALAAPPREKPPKVPKPPRAHEPAASPALRSGLMLHGVEAIALFLGMTVRQARHRCQSGQIPTFKLGRSVCAHRAVLKQWLDARARDAEVRS